MIFVGKDIMLKTLPDSQVLNLLNSCFNTYKQVIKMKQLVTKIYIALCYNGPPVHELWHIILTL